MARAFSIFFVHMILFFSIGAHAIVDMRNANYSDTWVDLQVKGSAYDLRIQRTYNSRTLFSGMFGFGWCAEFETTLTLTATNTLRITECGAGMEVEYAPESHSNKNVDALVKKIMVEVKNRNKNRDAGFFTRLEADLRRDGTLRDEFAKQLDMGGKVAAGQKYTANNRSTDYVVFSGTEYVRYLPNSTIQKFNKDGRLIQMSDKNSNYIRIAYNGNRIVSLTDAAGAAIQFKYNRGAKYISEASAPGGLKATYKFSGENLVSVANAWKNTFTYAYDDMNNMTQVTYPDKSTIQIAYNKDKDWVTSFKDRNNCVETYAYTQNSKDPLNNYTSSVEKKCNGKVTNKSTYEFWHKTRKDGSRYLARARADNNGSITDSIYHDKFGRPTELKQDNVITRFEYNKDGLLSKKIDPFRSQNFSYDAKCGKVSQVVMVLQPPIQPRQTATRENVKTKPIPAKKITTRFLYDPPRCNLVSARNSDGQNVNLNYDVRGRITKIVDQSKKEVNISYEERFGKPHIVSRPGLGTIKFRYKADGSMDKFESDEDPTVAIQVASIFSNLLEIIAPATTDINNI